MEFVTNATHIWQFFSHLELFPFRVVCRSWQKCIDRPESRFNIDLRQTYNCVQLLERMSKDPLYRNVSWLSLEFNPRLTDDSLRYVCAFPKLTVLNLNGCSGLTDNCLRILSSSSIMLTSLQLYCNVAIANKGLAYLSEWQMAPHLTHLNLSGQQRITDGVMILLVKVCRQLRILDLTRLILLSDRSAIEIGLNCAHLRSLKLYGVSKMTDRAVFAFAQGCHELEEVDFCGWSQLTDNGISSLATQALKLRSINLTWCIHISDTGIEAIATHLRHSLTHLSIHGLTKVTDRCVVQLSKCCPHVQVLDLNGCKNISIRSFQALQNLFPLLSTLVPL